MKKSEVLSLLLCYNFEKEFKYISDKFIIKIDNNKYPDEIFYFINDKLFMNYEFKTSNLWCRYYDFWKFFESKFDFNYEQVKFLIKYQVEKHFKLNGVTPVRRLYYQNQSVEEHFKLNGVTPRLLQTGWQSVVEEHFKLNEVTPI